MIKLYNSVEEARKSFEPHQIDPIGMSVWSLSKDFVSLHAYCTDLEERITHTEKKRTEWEKTMAQLRKQQSDVLDILDTVIGEDESLFMCAQRLVKSEQQRASKVEKESTQ